MSRIAGQLLNMLMLALCLACLILWAHSYFRFMAIYDVRPGDGPGEFLHWGGMSASGYFRINRAHRGPNRGGNERVPPWRKFDLQFVPDHLRSRSAGFLMFSYRSNFQVGVAGVYLSQWTLTLPYWVACVMFGVSPFLSYVRYRRRIRRRCDGSCSSCGYDLRASTGCCPECGTAIPARSNPTPPAVAKAAAAEGK